MLHSTTWYKTATRIKDHQPGRQFHDLSFLKTSLFALRPVFQPGLQTGVLIKAGCGVGSHPQRNAGSVWGEDLVCGGMFTIAHVRRPHPLMKEAWGTSRAIRFGLSQFPASCHHSAGLQVSEHRPDTGTRLWCLNGPNHSLTKTKTYCLVAVSSSFQNILELLCRPF